MKLIAGTSCSNADLKLSQEATGSQIGGKPEFKVSLANTCSCVFVDVILSCGGFQTKVPIDPWNLKQDGEDCTINGGNPIAPESALNFKYAWDQSYNFTLKNYQIGCS